MIPLFAVHMILHHTLVAVFGPLPRDKAWDIMVACNQRMPDARPYPHVHMRFMFGMDRGEFECALYGEVVEGGSHIEVSK